MTLQSGQDRPRTDAHYGADCPVVVVFRATRRDESAISGILADIREKIREEKIAWTALIFVGRVFDEKTVEDRRHYPADLRHILRPR